MIVRVSGAVLAIGLMLLVLLGAVQPAEVSNLLLSRASTSQAARTHNPVTQHVEPPASAKKENSKITVQVIDASGGGRVFVDYVNEAGDRIAGRSDGVSIYRSVTFDIENDDAVPAGFRGTAQILSDKLTAPVHEKRVSNGGTPSFSWNTGDLAGAPRHWLPVVYSNYKGFNTKAYVHNPSPSETACVGFRYWRTTGEKATRRGTDTACKDKKGFAISPGGTLILDHSTNPPLAAPFIGGGYVQSMPNKGNERLPLVVTVEISGGDRVAAHNAIAHPDALSDIMLLPVVYKNAGSAGWSSVIYVQKPDTNADPGSLRAMTITFRSKTGETYPIRVGVRTSKPVVLSRLGGLPNGFIGSATIVADNPDEPISSVVTVSRSGTSHYGAYQALASQLASNELFLPLSFKSLDGPVSKSAWNQTIHVQTADGSPARVHALYYTADKSGVACLQHSNVTGNARLFVRACSGLPNPSTCSDPPKPSSGLPDNWSGSVYLRVCSGSPIVAVAEGHLSHVKSDGEGIYAAIARR